MTQTGPKYDAAANSQRMADEIKRLREVTGDLGERLTDAGSMIARLRGLLARLEWAGTNPRNPVNPHCPVCGGWPANGHDPGCWLAAELRP